MQLQSLAKSTEALNKITNILNNTELTRTAITKELKAVGRSYTTETLKSALAQSTLNKEQIKTILSGNGLQDQLLKTTVDEVANAASTNMVSSSQAGTTVTTLGLSTAFKGLRITIKQTIASMLTFLTTNPVGWMVAAASAVGLVAFGMKKYTDSIEEAKQKTREAAEEAKNAVQNIKSDFDKLSSDTDHVKKKYAELAQEVENLGKTNQSHGNLNAEDYKEFLDLSNQLADLFPQLTKGYDDNGNAILNLSGNVDTIVGSLDGLVSVQQKLANQEIMKNMPDVWAGYMLDLEDFNDKLHSSENIVDQYLKWADALRNRSTVILESEYYNGLLDDAAEAAGIMRFQHGNDFYKEKKIAADAGPAFISASWDFSKLSDEEYEKLLEKLGEFGSRYEDTVQIVKGNIASANSGMASYINTWLSTEWNYNKLDPDMQNAVKSMLFDCDWVNLMPSAVDSGNWDDVSNWLQQEILYEINKVQDNEEISKALSEVFANTELTPEAKIVYIKQIQDFFGEGNGITVFLQPQLEETETLHNQYQDAISRFGKGSQYKLEKFFKDNSINDSSEIAYWNEITNGAENATQAIEMYESKLAELEKKDPLPLSDLFSLKDAENNLTSLGKISESIDTVQNAYKTLSDAIDEYNQNGAFSIDTLQSVIALGDDWLDYLVDEEGNLTLDKESLENLTRARLNDMRVQAVNNIVSNVESIRDEASANEYLASTNYALADSYEAVAIAQLASARASMEDAVKAGTLSQSSMDAALKKANADISKINKLFANTTAGAGSIMGGGNSGSGSGASSARAEFSETIDFFKERVETLDDALSHLDAAMDNLSGSFGKNSLIDAQLGISEEKLNNYTDALALYTQKANEAFARIPAAIASSVKDGAVALTDFVGDGNKDVVEAINDYQSWADEISACKEQLAKLEKEIRQLELEKFNNIIADFNHQFDLRSDSKDLLSKQIDLLKETGQLIGESFYTAQIHQSRKQLELLETEKAQLINQMTNAVSSGKVRKGADEWLEMVNALSDVDAGILDCKKSMEEFDNSVLALHTEIFNRIQEQFSNLDSEISNILDLFDAFEISDEKGVWSKEGITQLGLLTQQYELSQYQIRQYNSEIDELNKQYLAGRFSATEYADKLAELSSAQWDAVKASQSAKDAIMDLNETRIENQIKGIEKEIDAYRELTDAQIDALKASKDLHE